MSQISIAWRILRFNPDNPGTIFMSEVNSISRGGNVGCTSPPVLVDHSITIFKWMQKEHRIVANVQKTMVALLKTKIPRETREARIELEQIVKESPKHLNALADLEIIYRNLYRITDADRYSTVSILCISVILNSNVFSLTIVGSIWIA
jgi:hypothetical protein